MTIENAVCIAVLQFSMGSTFKEVLGKVLGFSLGRHLQDLSRRKDQKRLLKTDKASDKASSKDAMYIWLEGNYYSETKCESNRSIH